MSVKPVYPPWAKPGCKTIRTWDEPITSGNAIGVARYVEYKDPQGKTRDTMMWVRWNATEGGTDAQ